jgi:glutathione S-transferase
VKLLWSSRSPFARKVMIAAHELGIADDIELERVVVDPAVANDRVMQVNPLGRIPTLILDDGETLHDSPVIIEYLDDRFGGSLMPRSGDARWAALKLQALADGIMEADLRLLEERKHLQNGHRDALAAGMRGKIAAALDALEAARPTGITVGAVALGSALAHLDFRFPDEPWRPGRPRLSAWFATFAARPSMRATSFVDQY